MSGTAYLKKMPYVPPLVEPEDEILENGEEEEAFLAAIHKGDINTFMDLIQRKDEIWLNLECKDANGKSALRIAIAEGYSVIVDQLLMRNVHVGDALLRAVDVGYLETVKKICEYAAKLVSAEERRAVLECRCEDDDFHPDVTPIILAAQRNDFSLIKTLLNAGTTIVNVSSKNFTTNATDSLQKSVGTLEIYKGLASEAYISLANGDPVDKAFVMSHTLKKHSHTDVEFKSNYLELANTIDQVGTDIISHARTTEEIMTVLTHHEPSEDSPVDHRHLGPLPKLTRAIDFDQRKFVAHPNCQQVVRTIFYGRLAYLRDKSTMYRFIFFLGIVFSFPFMSLTFLYFPTKWVKSTIGCPYVRFMVQLASDLFFVFLLFADTLTSRGVETFDPVQKPTKGIILLYVLGIGWRELKSVSRFGRTVFTQSRHLRDLSLVTLFLSSYLFGIADHYYNLASIESEDITNLEKRSVLVPHLTPTDNISETPFIGNLSLENEDTIVNHNVSEKVVLINRIAKIPISRARASRVKAKPGAKQGSDPIGRNITDQEYLDFLGLDWWDPGLMATAMFACSTVISFLRLFPYVVLSDVTGPLQISVGSMVKQTLHFFLVVGVVVLAFSIGLTYIYAYYDNEDVRYQVCVQVNRVEECRKGTLANLMVSVVYLYWSTFGLESMDPLILPGQARILQLAGTLLYAMFYVFVVVVLLNALIAVMSNVYNEVEENADVEWKFASTAMWLGVLQDSDEVPPPFNLLPSTEDVRWIMNVLYSKCWYFLRKQVARPDSADYAPPKVHVAPESAEFQPPNLNRNKKFKRSDRSQYRRVMSHLVERYVASKTANDVSVEADIGIADIRALRNDLLSLKFEMFQKFFDTIEDINRTIGDGYLIFKTSREANELFQRTEEIHSKVGTQLDTVLDFQTALAEKIEELKQKEPPPVNTFNRAIQVDLLQPPPPKPIQVDVSLQTSPDFWLIDADCQTTPPVVEDRQVQTESPVFGDSCTQTVGIILENTYAQTVPVPVQNTAIQTFPLPQEDSSCQTAPPPPSKSCYIQTNFPPVLRECAIQTNPPPLPPQVFNRCTQVTPPPSPPRRRNRSTQVNEKLQPPQREPWRPFGRSPSPMSNSSLSLNSDPEVTVRSTSRKPGINKRRASTVASRKK